MEGPLLLLEPTCHFARTKDVLFYVLCIGYYLLILHNNIDCNPLCLMSFLLVLLLSHSHFITSIEYLVCTVLST